MGKQERDQDLAGHAEGNNVFFDADEGKEGQDGYSDDDFEQYNDYEVEDESAIVGSRYKVHYNETQVIQVSRYGLLNLRRVELKRTFMLKWCL